MAKSADAFRTISEVAEWLGVQTHVLRFWESKFSQVKPIKRAGGRRYYRPTDMLLLGGIRKLLHEDGLTIKGVQKVLREEGMAYVADMSPPLDDGTDAQLEADLAAPVHEEFAAPIQEDFAAPMHEDFAAPMHEDAPPAPIQAEVLPFDRDGAQSAAEDTEDPFLPEQPDPAPVPETPGEEAALPSFMRSPMPKDAVDEEPGTELPFPPLVEDTPPPVQADTPAPDMAAETAHEDAQDTDVAAPAETEAKLPSFLSDYAAPAEATPEPEADPPSPKPRIVDVPDDPDPATTAVSPSVLSQIGHVRRLTGAQREMLRPLVAQLTALRDQMANSR